MPAVAEIVYEHPPIAIARCFDVVAVCEFFSFVCRCLSRAKFALRIARKKFPVGRHNGIVGLEKTEVVRERACHSIGPPTRKRA
jgi:hypothetical protein